VAEGAGTRVEEGGVSGILGDGFAAGVWVARDAKCALGPAEDAIGFVGALPEKQVNLFAGAEDGDGINVRMQVAGNAADGADRDDAGKETFVALEDFEAGFGPELAVVPAKLGAEAAESSDGGRLLREIFKAHAGERGGIGQGGGQAEEQQAEQETDPEKFSALHEAHFIAPRGRRWRRSCPDLCFE